MYGISKKKKPGYPFQDKERCIDNYVKWFFRKSMSMFEWQGLPDSIPQRSIELALQYHGYVGIVPHNGNLYALYGGLGGELDQNYLPTVFTFSSPYLKYSDNLRIGDDCVIIRNDSMYEGLFPLYNKYASILTENDISMRMQIINGRAQKVLSAADDATAKAATQWIKNLENGELASILDKAWLIQRESGLQVRDFDNITSSRILDGIEFNEYMQSKLLNEIGIESNYNMKRESINSAEAGMDENALLPLCDDMLRERLTAIEAINNMFGVNWSVKFSSAWERQRTVMQNSDAEIVDIMLEEETVDE